MKQTNLTRRLRITMERTNAVALSRLICVTLLFLLPAAVGARAPRDLPESMGALSRLETSPIQVLDAEGQTAQFSSTADLLDFLATAQVIARKPIGSGINNALRLTLERDGVTLHAAFRTVEQQRRSSTSGSLPDRYLFRDSYVFEVAAYRLDRLLGLGRVPPTVLRAVDGKQGSVQLWVEGARTGDRVSAAERDNNVRSMFLQRQIMKTFDALIYNFDRHEKNVLFDEANVLWMIDHTRSFRRLPELPRNTITPFLVERRLYRALGELNRRTLGNELRDVLGRIEIDALWARRNQLLRNFEQLIEERGPSSVIFDLALPKNWASAGMLSSSTNTVLVL